MGDTDLGREGGGRMAGLIEIGSQIHPTIVRQTHNAVKARCAISVAAVTLLPCHGSTMAQNRNYLAAWRKAQGWSQTRLANELGTTHPTIGRYERGELRVDDAIFRRIAAAYGITPAELAGPPDQAGRAREMHRVITAIRELDEGALRALAEMAERLPRRPPD